MSFAVPFAAAAVAASGAGSAADRFNTYEPPAHCRDVARRVAERQKEVFGRLDRLPPAAAIYAVDRRIAGCPVPTPVGYRQDYLLPGAADAPQFRRMKEPAKPKP